MVEVFNQYNPVAGGCLAGWPYRERADRLLVVSGLQMNITAVTAARTPKIERSENRYSMKTFVEWLAYTNLLVRLRLRETYYGVNSAQYNRLFEDELRKLMSKVSAPDHRAAIERMHGFNWVGYIAASLRHAGYQDQREVQEKTHDIVVKLLMGTLFRAFDERTSGPFDLRFKRSVANAIKNIVEKEKNRRRFFPSVSIHQKFGVVDLPGRMLVGQEDDQTIQEFRRLVRNRLGQLAVAVLDARLADQETKSLVGRPDLGSPNLYAIKQTVQEIKTLAQQYALSLGDPAFLRSIERAMGREGATVEKRRATMAARQGR